MKWKIEQEEMHGRRNSHIQCLTLMLHYSSMNKSTA